MTNQESTPETRESLKIKVLTQRIATLVAQYEDQMADFRAQATLQIEDLSGQIRNLSGALEEALAKNTTVVDERVAEQVDVDSQEV
jgi:hypothetical protein